VDDAHGGVRAVAGPRDMSLHRPAARLLRPATACTALAFYALWIRPQMLT
jgi:hypothetical protein